MSIEKYLEAFTAEGTIREKDYHEIHPEGRITRGQKDGVSYQQLLDDEGKVTWTVAVKGDHLGMFIDPECFAIVDLSNSKIVEAKDTDRFVKEMDLDEGFTAEELRDMPEFNHKEIVNLAHLESGCPMWGMSW